jgi:multidrug efflux system outer membrane protein
LDVPGGFRNPGEVVESGGGEGGLGTLSFREVYPDELLQGYIAEALTNNWDMRIAVARVLQAEAAAQVARSWFWPTVQAGGDLQTSRGSENMGTPIPAGVNPQREYGTAALAMPAYEVDLWGRLRRADEAAQARLLAAEESRLTVQQTLVAQVAASYFRLLALDGELAVSRATLTNSTVSLELARTREEGGVASMQDVYQAEALVRRSEASIAATLQAIEQEENQLQVLRGRNPGSVERAGAVRSDFRLARVPAGLPSELLERRPDLRLAEQQLVAANADIGQVKAAFYPQITLTGMAGFQSVSLGDLFTSGSRVWQFGPAVTVPVFTGGRLRGNLKQAEAAYEEAVAVYQKTVQGAFREVSDALVAYQRTREFRERQELLAEANRSAMDLAMVRYEGGVTSYLEVTYNQQQLFDSELLLARAMRDELLSLVQLYRALGGGWTADAVRAADRRERAEG